MCFLAKNNYQKYHCCYLNNILVAFLAAKNIEDLIENAIKNSGKY